MRLRIAFLNLTACSLFLLMGCSPGGGGGSVPLGIGLPGSQRSGAVKLQIRWPTAKHGGKLIPATADTFQVIVAGEGLASPLTTSGSRSQVQNGQLTLTLTEVPIGSKTVEVKAFNSSNGLVAHRLTTAAVLEGQTTTVTSDLGMTILEGLFLPASFSLNKDETILWVNSGVLNHSVKADNGLFDSGTLAPGATFSWTATTPGVIALHCAIHPNETGTLNVSFPAPVVTNLSLAIGEIGSSVTISGANFGASQGTGTIRFNGTTASVSSWSNTQIVCNVPPGATTGPVTVTVNSQSSNADKIYTVLPPFGYNAAVNYVTVGTTPISVAVGDLNGDGKPDLVFANWGSNNVSVLLGNGDGTFQPRFDYGTGPDPWSLAIGDLNGDGKLDLATANYGPGTVSVLLGNGNGTFQAPVNYDTGTNSSSVVIGDFNGDGRLDMAVANAGATTISILLHW
ncbi:MAG: VCBS repeat-containing protein [Armatimonadetes bacterium]|nr:VCBS repeat-containing protein [Armatimonadota bacterium]